MLPHYGWRSEQSVAIPLADQPGEEIQVTAEIEDVRVGADHDVRQGRGGTGGVGHRGFAALDRLAGEQAQLAEQPGRETGAVGGVAKGFPGMHMAPVGGVRGVVGDADGGQVGGGVAVQQFNVHVEVP